ncbi:hypothetical protein P8452_73188 [Trifolium repens]|nr:hypothetical protein P8452_73188 [Trifolium repens]
MGRAQVVAGTNYRLILSAAEGSTSNNYEAVVWERASLEPALSILLSILMVAYYNVFYTSVPVLIINSTTTYHSTLKIYFRGDHKFYHYVSLNVENIFQGRTFIYGSVEAVDKERLNLTSMNRASMQLNV